MQQSGLGSIAGLIIIIEIITNAVMIIIKIIINAFMINIKLIINVAMIIIQLMTFDTMVNDNHESKPGSIAGLISTLSSSWS